MNSPLKSAPLKLFQGLKTPYATIQHFPKNIYTTINTNVDMLPNQFMICDKKYIFYLLDDVVTHHWINK